MRISISDPRVAGASLSVVMAVVLSGCGGGGGSDTSAPAAPATLTLAAAPAIAPANGTTGAEYAPTVQFTASKAMAAAGIKLVCDGVAVAGKTTVSGAVATFKPDAPGVAANAQCTASVDATATKDTAGTAFTGSTALTSFTVKALACPGGSANTPPSFSGTALVAACGNVFIEPVVAKNLWPGIVNGIQTALEMDRKVYGTLQAAQPDVLVCQSGACADYFAGPRRRNVTLYPNTYAGQYVAPRMTVVLTSPTWTQNPYVLAHEFSHVEVAKRIGGKHVPAWFDEGLATYIAGEPICTNVTGKGIDDLRKLDQETDWVAYTGPEDVFFKTYCQARAEVAAWIGKRGNAGVVQLLDAVRQGQSFTGQYGQMLTQ
ncbi:Ig-like domain-containing protein [Acidovorax temperans]|uniref:Ig-like domain-containing protein n=1 Tax=Acidovorax temperans TaxID=80878 RepID=UPI0035B22F83